MKKLEKDLKLERFVKKMYAGFLFLMMALIPLILILRLLAGR